MINSYKYLNTSDGLHSTTSIDSNNITVYAIDVTEAVQTQSVGINKRAVAYELIGANLTGTGTVKLQFSFDDITWTDAVDNSGNAISYSLTGAFSEVVKDFQLVGNSQRWHIDGSNTAGTITIKLA